MAAKLAILIIASCLIVATLAAGDCPSYNKVQTCTPKCLQDSDCSTMGGKCCPNLCNSRSCAQPNQLSNDNSKYGNNNRGSGGTGSYCGNVKCNSYEKCGTDTSKRPKCVRA